MHIVYLCNEYPPSEGGGIGTFTRTIARQLVHMGCRVTVLGQYCIPNEMVEDDHGVKVIRIPMNLKPWINLLLNPAFLRKRLEILHQETPIDIIEGAENAFWALPSRKLGKKIIRMHGGHHFFSVTLGKRPKMGRGLIEKLSFKHADHLCAVSGFVAETTQSLLGLGEQAIEIIPNPVDTEIFHPRPEILEEPGLILFIGTVCEKKGIRQLIEAMSEIIIAEPNAHLAVLGRDGRDALTGQNYRQQLEQSILISLRDRIQFIGPVAHSETSAWLARAEVCVYPSLMEAFGLTWLEGLAAGKAVIASRIGPGPELIDDGDNGLLCDPYDPHSIAEAVILALKDGELRKRLGSSARKMVEERFSVEYLAERNLQYYLQCLHKSR